jgi:hypothetical protein
MSGIHVSGEDVAHGPGAPDVCGAGGHIMTVSLPTMSRRFSFPAIALLTTLCVSSPAAAEPIVVTGGFLQVHTRIAEGFFTFEGDDFFLTGSFDGVFGSFSLACEFCAPGTPVELDSHFDIQLARGRAVVNGTGYSTIWLDGSRVAFDVPTARITGSESTQLILPFEFRGMVQFFAINPFL